uniref:Uncharacterized protein n=1 Tax=Bostrychia moritziana TaxID=103713 RepID=A0A1Z1M6I8_BOSMO|nr:hypothetical protein [Bostrychia moritziana]ARW61626.1 hypothetical protein [Bostrychia moritziana]
MNNFKYNINYSFKVYKCFISFTISKIFSCFITFLI